MQKVKTTSASAGLIIFVLVFGRVVFANTLGSSEPRLSHATHCVGNCLADTVTMQGDSAKAVGAWRAGLHEMPSPSPSPMSSPQPTVPTECDAESQLGSALFFHNEDQRAAYTIVDVVFLKHIATALEEYAADNNNRYPDTLSDISEPPYLDGLPIVPGSVSGAHYGYQRAPADRRLGSYVITDADATVDATLVPGYQVPRGVKGIPCRPGECRHLEYSQKVGLIGLP